MPSNLLILCHPLLHLPLIFPSIRVFSNESALCKRWPSIAVSALTLVLPMIQDWFLYDGLVGSPCSPRDSQESSPTPQFKSITILWRSAFFTIHLSHPYMTTGKTIALTRWTFVGKVMSLLLNMLSRLITTFLPRSKCLLIHGCNHHLQWFGVQKNKVWHCFPIYFPWSVGTRCHDLSFLNVEL